MSDADIRAARDRIDTVEKRIAALAEAGVDVAALRAQLAFAHGALREGRLADVEAISDEVLAAARRLAELGGRSSPHPAQTRTPASGTEALQRVKVQRAQLAEEVRAAIDAEVQSQMVPGSALAKQVEELARQVAGLTVADADSRLAGERLRAIEIRLAAAETQAPDQELARRLAAIDARLAGLERQPAAGADPALAARLAALEQRPQVDSSAVATVVARALEEAVPRQTGALMQEALSRLPTRDDLAQIADTLRADLDWRLERAAAEHGWCSLADVQATVRKAIAEQDPGGGPAPSQLARLENSLAEFVQHSREQQDRLINALAERVAQHTKTLTKRMLVREPTASEAMAPRSHETEELAPSHSESGHGSSGMLAITGTTDRPGKSPTEISLDPVPPEVLDRTRETHGLTTRKTCRVPTQSSDPNTQVELPSDPAAPPKEDAVDKLNDLVTAEVERALSAAVASTLGTATEPPPAAASRSTASTGLRALIADDAAKAAPAELAAVVSGEIARQLAARPAAGDPAALVIQALNDPTVRTELFAVLALEAAGKPGALGELTGLRRFLKRELDAAAERMAQREAVPA